MVSTVHQFYTGEVEKQIPGKTKMSTQLYIIYHIGGTVMKSCANKKTSRNNNILLSPSLGTITTYHKKVLNLRGLLDYFFFNNVFLFFASSYFQTASKSITKPTLGRLFSRVGTRWTFIQQRRVRRVPLF